MYRFLTEHLHNHSSPVGNEGGKSLMKHHIVT